MDVELTKPASRDDPFKSRDDPSFGEREFDGAASESESLTGSVSGVFDRWSLRLQSPHKRKAKRLLRKKRREERRLACRRFCFSLLASSTLLALATLTFSSTGPTCYFSICVFAIPSILWLGS